MLTPLELAKYYAPIFHFHQDEKFFPCAVEYLLQAAAFRNSSHELIKWSPSQADLSDGKPTCYVDICPSQYEGTQFNGQFECPIYYAVQNYADVMVIHYLLLFAYQGGQTCRALRSGSEFNCIVNDFGIHQGDLERVAVVLSKNGERVFAVDYEAHGDVRAYSRAMVPWVNDARGWHPVVHVALNAHSLHNVARQGHAITEFEVPAAVRLVSECGQGPIWDPSAQSAFRLLSIVDEKPVGTELWAGFAGRLGKHQDNALRSATKFNGSNLDSADWSWVKILDGLGRNAYPKSILSGDGPLGPAARSWVKQPAAGQKFTGPGMIPLWSSPNIGTGSGAIAFMKARINNIDKDNLLQFWNHDGQASVVVFDIDDNDNLAISSSADLGQGPGAIGWVKGRFRGSELEQVIQLWDNGTLGMILYGIGPSNTFQALWGTGDMGQGAGNIAWQVGDFTTAGQDQVLQCYNHHGQLGLILYGADGAGGLTCKWGKDDMGQGSGAVKWLAGDFNGDGRSELLQLFSNHGRLGMILWGADGSGGMHGLWMTGDAGQGSGAVQWLVGDFNDDGVDEVVQCFNNDGRLGMILYGADGSGGLVAKWGNADMGLGSGAVAWLVGDFEGEGHDRILQCMDSGPPGFGGGPLTMAVYGYADGAMSCLWGSGDTGNGPGAMAWLAGKFSPVSRDRVLQLWDNGGSLSVIQYGTAVQT